VTWIAHCDSQALFKRFTLYSAASLAPLFRCLPAFASTGAKNLPV
jgi:hypothetical protein